MEAAIAVEVPSGEDPRRPLEEQIADCLIMLAATDRAVGDPWDGFEPLDRIFRLTEEILEYPPNRGGDVFKARESNPKDSSRRSRLNVEIAGGLVAQIELLAWSAVSERVLDADDNRAAGGPIIEDLRTIREAARRVLVALGYALMQPGDSLEVVTWKPEAVQ